MSKDGNRLARTASLSMRIARRCLSEYSHPKSKHTFAQAQLMTCLVLRAYLKSTYRGIVEILEVSEELRARLGLESVPHYSTLKKFADRAGTQEVLDGLMAEILREVGAPDGGEIAVDSTGMESTSASAHYVDRRGRKRKRFVKISTAVLCGALLPCATVVDWGPRNDGLEVRELLDRTFAKLIPKAAYFDAGYDSEATHAYCRDGHGVASYIPPVRRRREAELSGRYRRQMDQLPPEYGRRWHVESFYSSLKRTMGSGLSARSERALFTEAGLRVLAYALRR